LTNDLDTWADALPAWVPLAKLLDTVERQLGILPGKSRDVLKLRLETMSIRTLVVDGDGFRFKRSPQRDWVAEGDRRGEYRVSRSGWPHVLWEYGLLDQREVRVYWDDVRLSLVPTIEHQKRETLGQAEQANQIQQSTKRKGGRLPSPHLDKFWIEVAIWVDQNGFDKVDKLTLQKKMEEWATQTSEDPDKPIYSDETIRDKLRALYDRAAREN
jgi:hypothetical protein